MSGIFITAAIPHELVLRSQLRVTSQRRWQPSFRIVTHRAVQRCLKYLLCVVSCRKGESLILSAPHPKGVIQVAQGYPLALSERCQLRSLGSLGIEDIAGAGEWQDSPILRRLVPTGRDVCYPAHIASGIK